MSEKPKYSDTGGEQKSEVETSGEYQTESGPNNDPFNRAFQENPAFQEVLEEHQGGPLLPVDASNKSGEEELPQLELTNNSNLPLKESPLVRELELNETRMCYRNKNGWQMFCGRDSIKVAWLLQLIMLFGGERISYMLSYFPRIAQFFTVLNGKFKLSKDGSQIVRLGNENNKFDIYLATIFYKNGKPVGRDLDAEINKYLKSMNAHSDQFEELDGNNENTAHYAVRCLKFDTIELRHGSGNNENVMELTYGCPVIANWEDDQCRKDVLVQTTHGVGNNKLPESIEDNTKKLADNVKSSLGKSDRTERTTIHSQANHWRTDLNLEGETYESSNSTNLWVKTKKWLFCWVPDVRYFFCPNIGPRIIKSVIDQMNGAYKSLRASCPTFETTVVIGHSLGSVIMNRITMVTLEILGHEVGSTLEDLKHRLKKILEFVEETSEETFDSLQARYSNLLKFAKDNGLEELKRRLKIVSEPPALDDIKKCREDLLNNLLCFIPNVLVFLGSPNGSFLHIEDEVVLRQLKTVLQTKIMDIVNITHPTDPISRYIEPKLPMNGELTFSEKIDHNLKLVSYWREICLFWRSHSIYWFSKQVSEIIAMIILKVLGWDFKNKNFDAITSLAEGSFSPMDIRSNNKTSAPNTITRYESAPQLSYSQSPDDSLAPQAGNNAPIPLVEPTVRWNSISDLRDLQAKHEHKKIDFLQVASRASVAGKPALRKIRYASPDDNNQQKTGSSDTYVKPANPENSDIIDNAAVSELLAT